MKNPRDPLDDELKKRLDDYTEEPDDALWSGIASNIQSVPSTPTWIRPVLWGTSLIVVSLITFVVTRSIYKVEDKNSAVVQTVNEQLSPVVMNSKDSMSNKKQDVKSGDTKSNDIHNNELRKEEKKTANDEVRSDERSASLKNPDHSESVIKNKKAYTTVNKQSTETHAASSKSFKNELNDSKESVSPLNEQQVSKTEKNNGIIPIVSSTTIQDAGTGNADQTIQAESDQNIVSSSSSQGAAIDSVSNLKPVIAQAENAPKRKQAAEVTEDKDEKDQSARKLNLYVTAMPTFGYNRIEANTSDNVMIESIGKVSNFSAKRLGVRVELGAEYAISRRTRIFAGLLYFQRKQTIDYVEKTVTNVIQETVGDTTIVFDPEYSYEEKTFEYELKNIGVQFGLNYVIREGKFVHFLGTGIEFHKALNKPEEKTFGDAPSTYVFYNLYYRLQYPAKGKLRAIFQPTFNYSLYLNQDMNAPFYVKPYGLGLNLGVTYSF